MAANPLAEKRRLRDADVCPCMKKLENQGLEDEAKRRQEELRVAQEQERQRIENERIAEQQRKLHERELIRLKAQAELDRIARLEQEERNTVSSIEKQLRLVGAFCTGELELRSGQDTATAFPLSVAVLTLSALETPIVDTVETSIVLVANTKGLLYVYSLKRRTLMFSVSFAESEFALQSPASMDRNQCVFIDLRTLFKLFFAVSGALFDTSSSNNSSSSSGALTVDGSAAVVWFCGSGGSVADEKPGESEDKDLFASPRGVAFADTSNELFVSDQMNHRVKVYSFSPVALTELLKSTQGYSSATQKQLVALSKKKKNAPVMLNRAFGSKGHGRGQLQCPSGLDVSHYHVVVCDVGNHRLSVFAKRGTFVRSFGSKGTGECEFHDPRDVKLVNVRKCVISRDLPPDERTISNEQFEIVVADLGNFRIQILNENGEFLRYLSLLGSYQQIAFQRDQLNGLHTALLREFATLKSEWEPLPSLSGLSMDQLYALAARLHPSCPAYARIAAAQSQWRETRSRFHHPLAISYAPTERELVFVDQENAEVFIYNADGSRLKWLNLSSRENADGGGGKVLSVHSCLQLSVSPAAEINNNSLQRESAPISSSSYQERLYVSDPQSHRVAVLDAKSLQLLFYIGATTYGNQTLCSPGYLPGELHNPSFLAFFTMRTATVEDVNASTKTTTLLVVSDSGNHTISLFDASSGAFCGRVGEGFGHLEGYLDSPQGVAVLEDRWLYVCDQRNHRVQVFDLSLLNQEHQFVRAFGGLGNAPGEFSFPVAVAICPALPRIDPKCNFGPHREAKVVVGDTGSHCLQIFAADTLQVLVLLDVHATPFNQPLVPLGVFVEPRNGCILVCDAANKCVLVFRRDRTFLASFGSTVEPENRFERPMNITFFTTKVGREGHSGVGVNGELLIADAGRCDVCVFGLRQGLDK